MATEPATAAGLSELAAIVTKQSEEIATLRAAIDASRVERDELRSSLNLLHEQARTDQDAAENARLRLPTSILRNLFGRRTRGAP